MVEESDQQVGASAGRRFARIGGLLFVVALLFRGAVCFSSLDSFEADPDAYRVLAEAMSTTGTYGLMTPDGDATPTAFRPPLYPYLLSWLTFRGSLASTTVAILHTLLGAITVVLTLVAAARYFGFRRQRHCIQGICILASALVLVDPILLQQSTEVMTETLATMLAAAVIACWAWSIQSEKITSVLVLGGLLSLAFLCRPTFLVWGLLLIGGWLISRIPIKNPKVWIQLTCLAGVFFSSVGLWTARNLFTIGHPVWATTHGGYTLLLANNPSFYDYLRHGNWGDRWEFAAFENAYLHRYDGDPKTAEFWDREWTEPSSWELGNLTGVTEVSDDRLAYEAAKATIGREPVMFVWSCVVRVGRLWSPIPHATPQRSRLLVAAVGSWYVLSMVLAIFGVLRLLKSTGIRWRDAWAIASLLFTLTAVHAVYWSNMRMRAPAVPAISILVAAAFLPRSREDDYVADG